MSFLLNNPFFRLLIPLIAGIIFFYIFPQNEGYVSFLISIIFSFSVILIVLSWFLRNKKSNFKYRWIFGIGLFLLLFSTGVFLTCQKQNKSDFLDINIKSTFSIELTEIPIEKTNSFLCRVKVLSRIDSAGKFHSAKEKALIYIAKDSASQNLTSGDRLITNTTFKKPDGVINPNGFDYASYLQRQEIGATTYIPSGYWQKYGQNTNFSLIRTAEKTQEKLMKIYRKFGISGDEFAVLAALTLGSKDALHPELRQNYTTSGGMHILAVSGLHVGIIYIVLVFAFSFLGKSTKLKLLKTSLIILFLWFYAFITGLPPSVIRATLMFSLIALGTGLERKAQIYNTISMSAFFMLLVNPFFLFDVGFQLSFSAVVAIVYFQPKISKLLTITVKPLKWMWDLTAVSLAAQIGTAPFSIFYFHQFPNYFFITNLLAIPIATFIIYTAVALFVFSPVPYISTAIAFILKSLLIALNFSIEKIHHLPFSLTITYIDFWQLLLIYVAIALFTIYLSNKKFIPLLLTLISLLIFSEINLHRTLNCQKINEVLVFSDNTNTHVSFIKNGRNFVFTTDSTAYSRVSGNFILANKLINAEKVEEKQWFNNGFAYFNDKKFLILTDENFNKKTSNTPLKIDYLIIGNKLKPRINDILNCITPTEIIVDKTISEWYTQQIKQTCNKKNIRFYALNENRAYILNFNH